MTAFQPGLIHRLPGPPAKIAVLRAARIGDFICATPALRALRRALPAAEITLITLPMLHDLATRLPYVDRYAPFPGFPGLAEQLFDPRAATRFFTAMQAEEFDLAIQLQGSGVYANPFTLLLGARHTAGFIRPTDSPGLLAAALPLPQTGHEIDRALALVEFIGAPAQGRATHFGLLDADHAAAAMLLAGAPRPLIGLHPAARDRTRRWPPERFAAAAAALQARAGGSLVLLGEPEEAATAQRILATLPPRPAAPSLDLTGRTSLPVLGAVIARLDVLLTNDSGPAHIAYALGAPTVTVFGAADPRRYAAPLPGPFHMLAHPVPCRPCEFSACPIAAPGDEAPCLEGVTVATVVTAASELLASAHPLDP